MEIGCPSDHNPQWITGAEGLHRPGACPIVGSFGAGDRFMRGAADRLEAALTEAGVEHDVKEYPGAGHSFLNQHTGALVVLEKVFGSGYRPGPAQDAQRRIDAFFAQHLR